MRSIIIQLAATIFLDFSSQPAWAHKGHENHESKGHQNHVSKEHHDHGSHNHHDHSSCGNSCSGSKKDSKLKSLAHLIHESITGEHVHTHSFKEFLQSLTQHRTWSLWLQGIQNLPSAPVNFERAINSAAQADTDPEFYKRHAKNIFVLYGIGEAVEIFVVPALGTSFALESDSSPVVRSLVGGFSYLTAIPMVEPFCGFLMACYFLSDKVKIGTTWMVNSTFSLSHSTYNLVTQSHPSEYSPLALSEAVIGSLSDGTRFNLVVQASNEKFQVKIQTSSSSPLTLFELGFAVESYESPLGYQIEANLEKLIVDPLYLSDPQFVNLARSLAGIYGKNVHSAVAEALKKLDGRSDRLRRRFYIEDIQQTPSRVSVTYKPNSVFVRTLTSRNISNTMLSHMKRCERLLSR